MSAIVCAALGRRLSQTGRLEADGTDKLTGDLTTLSVLRTRTVTSAEHYSSGRRSDIEEVG